MLISLITASCGDEDNAVSNEAILGTWNLASATTRTVATTSVAGIEATAITDGVSIDPTTFAWIFKSNPNRLSSTGSVTFDLTVTDGQGNDIPTTLPTLTNLVGSAAYEVAGNKLILTQDDGTESEVTILALNDSELSVGLDDTVEMDLGGATTTMERKATYRFTR